MCMRVYCMRVCVCEHMHVLQVCINVRTCEHLCARVCASFITCIHGLCNKLHVNVRYVSINTHIYINYMIEFTTLF